MKEEAIEVFNTESVFTELEDQLLLEFGNRIKALLTPKAIKSKLPMLEITVRLSDDTSSLRTASHIIYYNRAINIYESKGEA